MASPLHSCSGMPEGWGWRFLQCRRTDSALGGGSLTPVGFAMCPAMHGRLRIPGILREPRPPSVPLSERPIPVLGAQ